MSDETAVAGEVAEVDPAAWARELIDDVRPIAREVHDRLYPGDGKPPMNVTLAPMLARVLARQLPTPTPAEDRALLWLCGGEWETLAVIVGWIAKGSFVSVDIDPAAATKAKIIEQIDVADGIAQIRVDAFPGGWLAEQIPLERYPILLECLDDDFDLDEDEEAALRWLCASAHPKQHIAAIYGMLARVGES